jgi:hypothetical protein
MPKTSLSDALFCSLDSSICDIDAAETLPPECYTDPEFFAFETEAVFNREWLCVGRADWAKAQADYFTASHVGELLVIVRTEAGELKCLSTVCRHRAMLVAEGHGRRPALAGVRVSVRPHPGTAGVTPNATGRVSTIPPGPNGGNIDNWRIGAGAVMYYPAAVDGALFSVGIRSPPSRPQLSQPHLAKGAAALVLASQAPSALPEAQ